MQQEIRLPEISENVTSGTVFSILVEEGQQVEAEQPLIELESEKATVEVPSPSAGTIAEILIEEGQTAEVGQVIMKLETAGESSGAADPAGTDPAGSESAGAQKSTGAEETADASETERKEPAEPAPSEEGEESAEAEEAAEAGASPEGDAGEGAATEGAAGGPAAAPAGGEGTRVPASPAVRRFARELGADISAVRGSGPHGRISKADVQAHVKGRLSSGAGGQTAVSTSGPPAKPLPDFSQWGEIEREPFNTIRRVTAEGTARSWQTVPHVTHHDKADITDLEEFRKSYREVAERESAKLTVTAILVKVAAKALQRFPKLNASIDVEQGEIVYKHYVHIGVAVDTPRGLLMPVIRDVPQKGIITIAREIGELAQKAKEGRIGPDEMSGGSFAISNLGGIGGTSFTPIVYWPQAAILGVSRAETEPVWQEGQWIPRLRLPLSLSYDHRLIDGADGARFLRWIAKALQHPMVMHLHEGGEDV